MKLMIVDDHAGVRNLIRQLVSDPADLVCECSSGDEAVRRSDAFQPDCVTIDIRMPGIGGIETVRAIRRARPQARIFVVTTYDQIDLRHAADNAGATGYVVKENLGELRALVQHRPDRTENEAGQADQEGS